MVILSVAELCESGKAERMTTKTTTNMTYAETKANGATSIIYTTFHFSDTIRTANDREQNPATGNEFFTPEQARQRIEELQHRGYLHDAEYWQSPRPNTYTYELWPDATEYLDELIDDEREGRI